MSTSSQLHQLQELLHQLQPDPSLFADVSEAPCTPIDAAAAAAAARRLLEVTALVEQRCIVCTQGLLGRSLRPCWCAAPSVPFPALSPSCLQPLWTPTR